MATNLSVCNFFLLLFHSFCPMAQPTPANEAAAEGEGGAELQPKQKPRLLLKLKRLEDKKM
jgi:hypothetical protein